MKIVLFEHNKDGVITEIDGSLKSMQETVGGYIQGVPLTNGLGLVCDEDGAMRMDDWQRRYRMFGPFFICGSDDSDFASVHDPEWVIGNIQDIMQLVNRI